MDFCKRKGIECIGVNYCFDKNCPRNLSDISFDFTPNVNDITGVVDTETDGKKFAIGTKNHADTFVLNFSDRSCLLFMGDLQPVDLRKFNFNEFTCIEINGNRFVREVKD